MATHAAPRRCGMSDCLICRRLAEADKLLVGALRAREANDLVALEHLVASAHERVFVAKLMRHMGCARCSGTNVELAPTRAAPVQEKLL
jgi:hypothetical protein